MAAGLCSMSGLALSADVRRLSPALPARAVDPLRLSGPRRLHVVSASASANSQPAGEELKLQAQPQQSYAASVRETMPFASASTSVEAPPPSAPVEGSGKSPVFLYVAAALAAVGIFAALKTRGGSAAPAPATPAAPPAPLTKLQKPRREIAPAALKKISTDFSVAVVDNKFVKSVGSALAGLGFTKENTIALVSTCRDEITRPLIGLVEEVYGDSFNIAGLGGAIVCGKVGFKAGIGHSPDAKQDREKYVFFAFPHVGVDEQGNEGLVKREGQAKPSTACAALLAVKGEIERGATPHSGPLPLDDMEFGLLKAKLLNWSAAKNKTKVSLIDVTKAAEQVIREDIDDLISKVVDPKKADYAVVTGIQIHAACSCGSGSWTPDHLVDYIAPGTMYAVVNGQRYLLKTDGKNFYTEKATDPVLTPA